MGRKKKHPKSPKRVHTQKTYPGNRDGFRLKLLKPETLLIIIFILALSARLLYSNQVTSTPIFQGLAADTDKYNILSQQILKGNFIHKDFIYLNPLYPFFLALIYLIGGYSPLSVITIQAIIDSISCLLIYFIALRLFNKRIGLIAAFIYACYGIAIFYTGILLAPTLVIFFTLLFFASLLFAGERRQVLLFFISGILFGLVASARPNVTPFLFLLPLWFFTVCKNKTGMRKSIQGFVLLLVGFFTVISLITIRNYSIEKNFSPFSVQGGINFYIGNNPEATGRFMSPLGISRSPIEQVKTSIHHAEKESGKKLTPSQASRYWWFKGLKFIKDNRRDALFLYLKKSALFWRKEEISLNIHYSLSKPFVPLFQLPFISFGIIAPFALLGCILSAKNKEATVLVTPFVFCYMASVIIFFISARYRLPMVPFLIIFASYALYCLGKKVQARDVRGIALSSALLIPLSFAMNKDAEFANFISDDEMAHYNLGTVYLRTGKLNEAITQLEKALTLNPNLAEAHSNLGLAYNEKGLLDDAIAECTQALTINPSFAEGYSNLGAIYLKKGRLNEAITQFRKALAIDPNLAKAHNNLGIVYMRNDRFDEAIAEYKKSLAIDPNYEAHLNLSRAYNSKGMADYAIAEYNKALALNPNLAMAAGTYPLASKKEGIIDEAISEYNKAIAPNPNLAETYNNKGNAYLREGKLDEAITEYNKAIALNPNLAETYNNKGNAYMRKRKLDYAIAEYNKALALNPNFPEAHNNLSLLYYSKKNYKLAIVHCDKVAELRGSANQKLLKLLKPYR